MAKNKRIRRRGRISTLTQDGKGLFLMNLKIRQAFPDVEDRLAYVTALLNDFLEN